MKQARIAGLRDEEPEIVEQAAEANAWQKQRRHGTAASASSPETEQEGQDEAEMAHEKQPSPVQ